MPSGHDWLGGLFIGRHMNINTKFKLCVIALLFYMLLMTAMIAGVVRTVRDHHYDSIELEEVPVRELKPAPGEYEFHIQFCENTFGRLQAYLDCRDKILEAINVR